MAAGNHGPTVYVGYEDEPVTEKFRSSVNFTTNKIGGRPDCHSSTSSLQPPQCRLCGLHQLLALQLYVPLESSDYHRTLYVFACINPNCWNQHESWTCLRVQSLEEKRVDRSEQLLRNQQKPATTPVFDSWLTDSEDWGAEDGENGNAGSPSSTGEEENLQAYQGFRNFEEDSHLQEEFSELRVDDPNANGSPNTLESPVSGAVGRLESPQASAEIEGEESEVVWIDTPTHSHCDLIGLLREVTPVPIQDLDARAIRELQFLELFLSVDEANERNAYEESAGQRHVRELFLEYKRNNPEGVKGGFLETSGSTTADIEKYERGIPVHGDEMFHEFVTQIQKHPGQILRYCRDDSAALLLYPMTGCTGKCRHCGGDMVFELQVLPTIIPKLVLQLQQHKNSRKFQLEFGTVLIFTCLASCWSQTDSYREEHVVVQEERL